MMCYTEIMGLKKSNRFSECTNREIDMYILAIYVIEPHGVEYCGL
jgi:hypothetical protein